MTTRPPDYPPTPTLDRMLKVKEDSQKLGEFLDWLSEQGFILCEKQTDGSKFYPYFPTRYAVEELLAMYFGVDIGMAQAEQDAVLAYVRSQQEES